MPPEASASVVIVEPNLDSDQVTLSSLSSQDRDILPVYLLRFDRPETRRAYTNDLCRFFESDSVTLRMARAVSFVDFNKYIDELQTQGLKSSTIQRKISSVRGFYAWLIALQLTDHNPADRQLIRRVSRNTKSQDVIVVLTQSEASRLIGSTCNNGDAEIRDFTLLRVMIHCALRRSEAARMDVEHIRKAGAYWVLDLLNTKGGAAEYVKIPDHVVEDIEYHKSHYNITQGPLWRSLSRNSSRGKRLSPAAIYELVRRSARKAGLDSNVGAHTLRHTGCTLAIEAGASPQQVQTHARHKRLETTMGYIHQRDKLRDSAADYIKL